METSTVHISSRSIRRQMCWRRTCITSEENIGAGLYSYNRMGRLSIHRNHIGLGLQTTSSPPSMPGYAKKALKQFKFKHTARKKQNQTFPSAIIQYGATKQYAKGESKSPRLDKAGKKFIQQVCGKFLFLGRAMDSTLLLRGCDGI